MLSTNDLRAEPKLYVFEGTQSGPHFTRLDLSAGWATCDGL